MISKIRHYFKRRKALKLFADKFLFEPTVPPVVVPAMNPQTTLNTQPPPQNFQPAPPTMPAPLQQPVSQPAPPIQQIPVQYVDPQPAPANFPVNTRDEIVKTLEPMAQAKMDVINRRIQ